MCAPRECRRPVPEVTFEQLVTMMVGDDMARVARELEQSR